MSAMESLTYTDFSRIVHRSVNPLRVAVNGTIEVTNRCPLTCSHCYNNLPMADGDARSRELTTEEHYRIVDEIVEAGCLWLLYTGGEIFARADFLDIYIYAKKKGLLITLFTNGVLITERIANVLAEWPPFAIEITLYGRTRETYEKLTGIPGSFDKCMRGIELLLERGMPLKLKTVAVSVNAHEVFGMRDFAESLGVEFKFDAMINPRIDCSSSPLAVRLSPSQIVMFDLLDPERVSEWRRLAVSYAPPLPPRGEVPQMYQCGGGMNSFAIDPYGKLTICVISHFDEFDLRKGSFSEGWTSFLRVVRDRRITLPTKCSGCGIKTMCGMCPANGELENGDPEKPVEFLCEVAHLRAAAFGVDVRAHGECEYCPGGINHASIESSASALALGLLPEPSPAPPPTRAAGCGSGGCSSGCSIAG